MSIAIITQPIFNILIAIVALTPGHYFAIGIIGLTVLIRTLLLIPSSRAMKNQKKIQALQPKIDKIKAKHGKNKQKISEDTMKLWKEHKVNPAAGCLPILIQLPVLWGIFFVLRNGITADLLSKLAYTFTPIIDVGQMNLHFFWIADISKPEIIVLPLLVGITQFIQMRTMQIKRENGKIIMPQAEGPMKMMAYFVPIMVAYSATIFSAGLALYWFTSILFSLFQQFYVNLKPETVKITKATNTEIIKPKKTKKKK